MTCNVNSHGQHNQRTTVDTLQNVVIFYKMKYVGLRDMLKCAFKIFYLDNAIGEIEKRYVKMACCRYLITDGCFPSE